MSPLTDTIYDAMATKPAPASFKTTRKNWTPEEIEKLRELYEVGNLDAQTCATKLHRSVDSVTNCLRRLRLNGKVRTFKRPFSKPHAIAGDVLPSTSVPKGACSTAPVQLSEFRADGDSATGFAVCSEFSLEALIAELKVDLNVWTVSSWEGGKWEIGTAAHSARTYCDDSGAHIKDEVATLSSKPLYRIRAKFSRSKVNKSELQEVFKQLVKEIEVPLVRKKEANIKKDLLLEISMFDEHISKLAWPAETGHAAGDERESIRHHEDAVSSLIGRIERRHVGRVLYPLGNDYFNSDCHMDMTTGGTPQDTEGRWQKTFINGTSLAIRTVQALANIAPVKVLMIAGNHDTQRLFYLGQTLLHRFEKDGRVSIDAENLMPNSRKYFRYGNNLLCFTHGDKMPLARLFALAPKECSDIWSEILYCEWHTGHFHRNQVNEQVGIVHRSLPSMSATDAWHAGKGFIGNNRESLSFLFHRDLGLQNIGYYRIQETPRKLCSLVQY